MKNKTPILYFVIIFLFNLQGISQNDIIGVVVDKSSEEELIGANIIIQNQNTGTTTDINGKFNIT